eukprot:317058-Amphidinium_carterae.1
MSHDVCVVESSVFILVRSTCTKAAVGIEAASAGATSATTVLQIGWRPVACVQSWKGASDASATVDNV